MILMWDLHELALCIKRDAFAWRKGGGGWGVTRLMISSVSSYEKDYIFEQDTGLFSFYRALFIAPFCFLYRFDHCFLTGAHLSIISSKSTVRRTTACISGFSSIYDSSASRRSDMKGVVMFVTWLHCTHSYAEASTDSSREINMERLSDMKV